jgi:hypothetical protein
MQLSVLQVCRSEQQQQVLHIANMAKLQTAHYCIDISQIAQTEVHVRATVSDTQFVAMRLQN